MDYTDTMDNFQMRSDKMKTKLIRITMQSNTWDSDIDELIHAISNSAIVTDIEEMD